MLHLLVIRVFLSVAIPVPSIRVSGCFNFALFSDGITHMS
jgi:hypothetical protein